MDTLIKRLLYAKIIEFTNKSTFNPNSFRQQTKQKTQTNSRFFAFNTKIKRPKKWYFRLFQLIKRKNWKNNLFYIKFDFKHAFFNIPLAEKSKFITNLNFDNTFYRFNRLPFRISVAPFVMQRFLNAVTKTIKKYTPYVWGHIDDMLVASDNFKLLKVISAMYQELLKRVNWTLNTEKSVLFPVKKLLF